MRLLTLFAMLCTISLFAQTQYEFIESEHLGQRELKIQLPRNYEENPDKQFPLIVVLDGDYLFEVTAGNVDFMSYWDDMPEAIVVGINQEDTKEDDLFISDVNHYPTQDGAKFFEFLGSELIPFMEDNYRVGDFKVGIGHGASANFINFFSFKKTPLFEAYVALSPTLSPYMSDNLTDRLSAIKTPLFYYLSTGGEDIKSNRNAIKELHDKLQAIDNKQVFYQYNNFENANHYALVGEALPKALQHIFQVYQPISKTEYRNNIVTLDTSPVEYLIEKYERIKIFFGLDKQILVNDFRAIAAAINKNKTFEYFEDLAKLARQAYPDTVLKNYYMGRYFEAVGNPKRAIKAYQEAYIYQEIEGISKDDLLERADQLKAEYGY